MSVQPIRPSEVDVKKTETIPDEVFEAFNELIIQNYSNGRAIIKQDEIVRLIRSKGISEEDIFRYNWIDIESAYREVDWTVYYDKPGNDSSVAFFVFSG